MESSPNKDNQSQNGPAVVKGQLDEILRLATEIERLTRSHRSREDDDTS